MISERLHKLAGTLLVRVRKSGLKGMLGMLAAVAAGGAATLAIAQSNQPYPAQQQPYPPPGQAQQPYPSQGPPPQQQRPPQQPGSQQPWHQPGEGRQQMSQHELRCMQLEQELANEWASRQEGRNNLPQIKQEIRKYDRIYQTTQAKAERAGCYESSFIFGRSLKRTPQCLKMNERIENARRQLARLQEQRAAATGGSTNRRRQDLVDALARAGCGDQYRQEARRGQRSGGGFFGWIEEGWRSTPRRDLETSRIEQYATYRTLCVRSCDGYYFPISYSTLPSHFGEDKAQCRTRCAAPAQLYVYRNPGEEPEQMVSADGTAAYENHDNAWRYRNEYVEGCSCKATEYDPSAIAKANQKDDEERSAQAGGSPQQPAPSGGQVPSGGQAPSGGSQPEPGGQQ